MIDQHGKRVDGTPDNPAIPPHMRDTTLNSGQKAAFAATDRILGRASGARRRSSGAKRAAPAKKAAPAKRTRAKRTKETAPPAVEPASE